MHTKQSYNSINYSPLNDEFILIKLNKNIITFDNNIKYTNVGL